MKINNIVSLSGGKDSTAMAILMHESGIPIHSLVYFDTGWDFTAITKNVHKLSKLINCPLVVLRPKIPFEYMLSKKPIKKRFGEGKGKIHRIGHGWPSFCRRWCTREKVNAINNYCKKIEIETGKKSISCIGFAYDEHHRLIKKNIQKMFKSGSVRFPLMESKIVERAALKICYEHGLTFGGLYNFFDRVSCFCCPLQGKQKLRVLRKFFPYYWGEILRMDRINPRHNKGFMGYQTAHDLERQFLSEDRNYAICDNILD